MWPIGNDDESANALAAIRDHRLCRTIRRGFVAISDASSATRDRDGEPRAKQQRLREQCVDHCGNETAKAGGNRLYRRYAMNSSYEWVGSIIG